MCCREPSAGEILTMKTESCAEPCATADVNAVCVDVIDHGTVETPWGDKPRISFAFETDVLDENGNPKILTRTFNNYAYSKSALTEAIKDWLDLDISGDDEDYDLANCVGRQARLHGHLKIHH